MSSPIPIKLKVLEPTKIQLAGTKEAIGLKGPPGELNLISENSEIHPVTTNTVIEVEIGGENYRINVEKL